MKLSKLIESLTEFEGEKTEVSTNLKVSNVCYDSRKVTPGSIFVAIKGMNLDGHDFITEAIGRGAVAIISQKESKKISDNIQYFKVNDTRKCLAEISCIVNGCPSRSMTMIGITGTNGKTTTSYIVEQIIKESGYSPGVIGTISNQLWLPEGNYPSTTPESLELQQIMRKMVGSNTHVVLEVSSHALDLKRVHGCHFDVAVFTNLTQDHLDYHNSLESYWNAKQKLFTKYLKRNGIAVVNIDDCKGKFLADNILKNNSKVITTGSTKTKRCDVWASSIKYTHDGTRGRITTPLGSFNFNSSLIGKFNLNNILSGVGVGIALSLPLNNISRGINAKITVPGRFNPISGSKKIFVYVDYAHTPDALKKVIKASRLLGKGKIITIFGCGGNRDVSKRTVMGKISGEFSDLSIITSDNPRSENLGTIIRQIEDGIKQTQAKYIEPSELLKIKYIDKNYTVVFDRRQAIFTGINAANYGDTVIIAGKGHETYQIIGKKTFQFDDRKEARKQLINCM